MMSLDELTFELERFEWQDDERLEVRGRWFGVRGQRFMRPTLHVRAAGRRRRMIALLDHKPWAPDAEGTWIAAFTWRGPVEEITSARLEVTPDVILDLGAPGAHGVTLNPRPRARRGAPKPAVTAPVKPAPAAPPPDPAAPGSGPAVPSSEPAVPGSGPATPPSGPASPSPEQPAPVSDAAAPPAGPSAPSPEVDAPSPGPEASTEPDPVVAELERRLSEESAARARVSAELELARRQLETQAGHHESAVERANEVVRLEGALQAAESRAEAARAEALTRVGELAAAMQRAEEAEAARDAAAAPINELAAAIRRAERAEAARDEIAARAAAAPSSADLAAAIARAEQAEARVRELAAAPPTTEFVAPAPDEELTAALARAEAARNEATARAEAAEARARDLAAAPPTTEFVPAARDEELAAAVERAERAEARAADLAASIRRGEKIEVPELAPLPRRAQTRSAAARHREWSTVERFAIVGLFVVAAVVLVVLVLALL